MGLKKEEKMANQVFDIPTVGLCLEKIKEFLENPNDATKKEMAEIAYGHLEKLFGIGYVQFRSNGCGSREDLT